MRIFAVITLLIGFQVQAAYVALDDLNLNRTATKMTSSQLSDFNPSHTGFVWSSGDNNTSSWRPQGIVGVESESGREWIVVSWYDRQSTPTRGARLSFVDVTDMNNIRYRHVLLVDENRDLFLPHSDSRSYQYEIANGIQTGNYAAYAIHAGGLAIQDDLIHMPGNLKGIADAFTFSINDIEEVTPSDYQNYRYIIRRNSIYRTDRQASFMSFDRSRNQLLAGKFYKCSRSRGPSNSRSCQSESPTSKALYWADIVGGIQTRNNWIAEGLFSEMQGAAANNGSTYIASSYGRRYKSRLYVGNIDPDTGSIDPLSSWTTYIYPPGLEDLHISASDNLWMLTEFRGKRFVAAAQLTAY